MAKTYKLYSLQQLAKQKIKHFSTRTNIVDIIKAINEDFLKLLSSATWFHNDLCRKASTAFKENHAGSQGITYLAVLTMLL